MRVLGSAEKAPRFVCATWPMDDDEYHTGWSGVHNTELEGVECFGIEPLCQTMGV